MSLLLQEVWPLLAALQQAMQWLRARVPSYLIHLSTVRLQQMKSQKGQQQQQQQQKQAVNLLGI